MATHTPFSISLSARSPSVASTRRAAFAVLGAAAVLALVGCDRAPLSAQQPAEVPEILVALEPVDRTPLRATISLPGLVFPRETYELGFPIGGVVTDVLVEEGAFVRRGQVIARLDGSAVRATRDQARASLVRAERELARARSLTETGSLPTATFEDAETGTEVARAGVVAASYAVGHSVLRASRDGTVDLRFVDPGEVVGPGTPVVRVVSAAHGWALRVAVPDRFVPGLREGDEASVLLDATGERSSPGRVVEIARVPTAGMGSFDVDLGFEAASEIELRTGLVGRAAIETGPVYTTSIPSSALVDGRDRRAFVYVVNDGRAERRAIEIGFVRGDRVAVAAGLEGVDRVVTRGADRLTDGAAVAVEP